MWKRHLIDAERTNGVNGPDSTKIEGVNNLGFHCGDWVDLVGMGCKGDVLDYDNDCDLDILATSHDIGGTYLFVNTLK